MQLQSVPEHQRLALPCRGFGHRRRQPAPGDVDDVLSLRLGAAGDIGQRVGAIEFHVRLGDRARQNEASVVDVQIGGPRERSRPLHRIRLSTPEIEVPAQTHAGLAHPRRLAGQRRGNDVVLRRVLAQQARVDRRLREQARVSGIRLSRRVAQPSLRLRQRRVSFERLVHEPIELRVVEAFPPSRIGPTHRDSRQAQRIIRDDRWARGLLGRQHASGQNG